MDLTRYVLSCCLLVALPACASAEPAGTSRLPPEATMVADLTDFPAPMAADGTLAFSWATDGEAGPFFTLQLSGGSADFGFSAQLSRERTADLVAGRLVESTGLGDGVIAPMRIRIAAVDQARPVASVRLALQDDSTVQITVQLGEAFAPAGAELAPTATLTIRGQLRLTCTIRAAEGGTSVRLDPAFTSSYCAELRTSLGLDPLLAISSSI